MPQEEATRGKRPCFCGNCGNCHARATEASAKASEAEALRWATLSADQRLSELQRLLSAAKAHHPQGAILSGGERAWGREEGEARGTPIFRAPADPVALAAWEARCSELERRVAEAQRAVESEWQAKRAARPCGCPGAGQCMNPCECKTGGRKCQWHH